MTSEERVKEKYPKARAEKYTSNMWGVGETYYLIWSCVDRTEKRRLGEGETKSKAWVNAKDEMIAELQCERERSDAENTIETLKKRYNL